MTVRIGAQARRDAGFCRAFVDGVLTDYMEDALSGSDRARVREHLLACRPCATLLDQQREVVALLRSMRGIGTWSWRDDVAELGDQPGDQLLG